MCSIYTNLEESEHLGLSYWQKESTNSARLKMTHPTNHPHCDCFGSDKINVAEIRHVDVRPLD